MEINKWADEEHYISNVTAVNVWAVEEYYIFNIPATNVKAVKYIIHPTLQQLIYGQLKNIIYSLLQQLYGQLKNIIYPILQQVIYGRFKNFIYQMLQQVIYEHYNLKSHNKRWTMKGWLKWIKLSHFSQVKSCQDLILL